MIQLYSLKWAPPIVRGYVRDVRVRWALEEAGLAYENVLVTFEEKATDSYRQNIQPFCQVPAYVEGDLHLSESGAIIHHIARKSEALMPKDPNGQAKVTEWMFAALNSIETGIEAWLWSVLFDSDDKYVSVRPGVLGFLDLRLKYLTSKLEGREFLMDRFTAADVLMASALNFMRDRDAITSRPVLLDYRTRCLARPACKKAFADHFASFDESAAP